MRMKKLLVTFLSLMMIIAGTVGNAVPVQAAADKIYIVENNDILVSPGQTTSVSIPVQSRNGYIAVTSITVSGETGSPFSFGRPALYQYDAKAAGVVQEKPVDLRFDVTVDDTAEIKTYPITFTITYYDTDAVEQTMTLTSKLKVQQEKTPAQLTISSIRLDNSDIGSESNLSFIVKNEGELAAKSAYLTLDFGTAMDGDYTSKDIKIGDLSAQDTKQISLPVSILSSATAGKNTITGTFKYKSSTGTSLTSTYKFSVKLTDNTSAPKLTVADMQYGSSKKPDDKFTLKVSLKNTGTSKAVNIAASVNAASITQDGIQKRYYSDGITTSNLKAGESAAMKIPLVVSKYATGGMKGVTVDISYKDAAGTKYTVSQTIYVDVEAAATSATPNIVIANAKQSVANPEAGDEVSISFYVENNGNVDATQFKIYADGLTNSTFIPIQSDPYQYIEKLAGGKRVKITMPFMISKSITEGLNNLTIKYSYTGGEGSAVIPVRNIKNDLGSSSIPKLIVSKYSTDKAKLKAGETFKFKYDVYNTNESVAAKNITVTIAQADNIFTVTQGSNSFFINRIQPGETSSNTVEMKVKSDATTKAYPITITIEYEYDGIEPNKETGQVGLTKTQTLSLNAEENARPMVDNIGVTAWEGQVMTGTAATLGFDFYNMGKAVLNNVVVTLEGDGFTKADGSMYFIGNVQAGSSTHGEFDVIPNIEGTASGTLKISYEDSNGDTVAFTKDFSQEVMPAAVTAGDTGGAADPAMNPNAVTAKKEILPIWAFVLLQLVIFAIAVPVSRKVTIAVYRKKLQAKEEEQY